MKERHTGTRIERVEDVRLLTGRGRYVDDLGADAVHVAFVRSEHAHARLVDIDVGGALDVEGVLAVYTFDDLEGAFAEPLPVVYPHPSLHAPRTPTALAGAEVCHVGQPVAMVVARSRYLAEDAAAAIRVTYEPLPVAIDLEATSAGEQGTAHTGAGDSLAAVHTDSSGDVDAAFACAERVFAYRFTCARAAGSPLEPRGVLARYDQARERLSIVASTQVPVIVRRLVAERFGLDPEAVDVVAPDVGGGFGTKAFRLYPEELLVPWASRQLGVPVKWTEDRREHFVGSTHQRSQIHDVRVCCDTTGRISGLDVRFLHDLGAFCQMGLLLPLVAGSNLSGAYAIPNVRYEFRAVYTNTMQTAPYRGAAAPFATFVIERTLDALARDLGIDRAEIRRRNLIPADAFPYDVGLAPAIGAGTIVYDSGDYEAGLDQVLDAIGYAAFGEERREAAAAGRRLGIGLAFGVESNGVGPYESARVTVRTDGVVTVGTGVPSTGQGHETVFSQIVADALAVPLERVEYVGGDTRRISLGFGTYASRVAVVAGNAVAAASATVRERALTLGARMLEAAAEDVELADGMVRARDDPRRAVPLAAIAAASTFAPPRPGEGAGLTALEYFAPAHATTASNVHACVVEIDRDTHDVRILRYVAQHDCGRALNPMIVDGQVVGGVAQGIADAFFERRVYDESGQLLNGSFMDYLMPFATEIPRIELRHTETPAPGNPLGVKGAGEGGTIPAAAALVSAIEDALGAPIDRTPLSPLLLFELDPSRS